MYAEGLPHLATVSVRISRTPVYGCQGNTGARARIDKGILSRVHPWRAFNRALDAAASRMLADALPLNELKHLANWIPRWGGAGMQGVDLPIAFCVSLLSANVLSTLLTMNCEGDAFNRTEKLSSFFRKDPRKITSRLSFSVRRAKRTKLWQKSAKSRTLPLGYNYSGLLRTIVLSN